MRLLAAALAERVAAAHVDGHAAAKIRQSEIDPAVAAIRRAEQRKQRLILIDGQKLPVAERPALRREGERHNANFRKEWFGHSSFPPRVRRQNHSQLCRRDMSSAKLSLRRSL